MVVDWLCVDRRDGRRPGDAAAVLARGLWSQTDKGRIDLWTAAVLVLDDCHPESGGSRPADATGNYRPSRNVRTGPRSVGPTSSAT